ncbi:TPA: excalibur calcium-binding domain-containing protein [Acinetobacter baumannii]|nr:excalibur calcium-binding domain-containing protein [Acinetobacter baumannii]
MRNQGMSKRYTAEQSYRKSVLIVGLGIVFILICSTVLYQKYQAHQQVLQEKTQLLIQQQKHIVEAQRAALGTLPDVKLTEKTKQNLAMVPKPVDWHQQPERMNEASEKPQFHCDRREHCTQMRSLDEARWFVRNCPNTKMDGDHDGEPCENDSRWH